MPPVVIAGGLAAAAGIGGAVIGSNSTKKAAQTAANTAAQTADKNNALAREVYGQNSQNIAPWEQRGNVAGDYYNAFLGLPSSQAAFGPSPQPASALGNFATGEGAMGRYWDAGMPTEGPPGTLVSTEGQFPPPQTGVTQGQAQNAFRSYIANSDYGFQDAMQGNSLANQLAAGGLTGSGAAVKAAQQYKTNLQNGYQTGWLGMLNGQNQLGLSGASALAGVGQNYVNNVTANNNSAGSAAANAALISGSANANMWNQIGGSVGNVLGSSYGLWGK